MAKITINGISIDPEAQGPALANARLISPDSATSDYILIQTTQPLNQAQRAELAALGATILEYVPENTYIAHYPPADLSPIRALPYVAWANIYLQGVKIPPALRPGGANLKAADLLALAPTTTSLSKELVDVDVVLHKGISADTVRDKIAAAAGLDPADLKVSSTKVRLRVQRRRLNELATIDEVRHIEPYVPPRLTNNVALGILRADVAHETAHLEGTGQILAVADTGFDKGSTNDVHPAFTNRVRKLYALGRSTASDPDGHGTHVAGSALGDGRSNALGGPIRGTAPKASLVLQSVLDSNGGLGGLPDDLHDLFLTPYRDDGARVHTNSWGFQGRQVWGLYNSSASEVDDFVWNHRDCVICFAAGNEGTDGNADGMIDAGSVTPPGTAKNCITVGASENRRPDFPRPGALLRYGQGWPEDFPAEPLLSDPVASNPDGMAAFSSRGPTRDRRIKPDVVAPGTAILSTRSRMAHGNGWGLSVDPQYFFEGGTSMATPLVAGCAAVVREYLHTQQSDQPSAALVKAMLINGAKNIPGQYTPSEIGIPPNVAEGFGRVDLAATVGPFGPSERVIFKDESTALDTGQEERTTATVTAPGAVLKVTLAWTDPAGEVLQNDLDLIVRGANGQERHGNMPPSSTDFDRTNNVEQVIWTDAPVGNVDILVRAHRITLHPQSYALVVRVA